MRHFSCSPTTIFGARRIGRFSPHTLKTGEAQADLAYFSRTDREPTVASSDSRTSLPVEMYQALVKTIG